MKVQDFLKENDLAISTEQFFEPIRFYSEIVSQDNKLKVFMTINRRTLIPIGEGKTPTSAIKRLVEVVKGKQLKVKGWNSKDEYIDLKIKVPNDLTIE